MDSFINLAKQGYEAYSESQGNVSKTGGEEYNAPSHSNQGDYQQGGQGYRPNINHQAAADQASQGSGEDSGMFSQAMNHVQSKMNHPDGVGPVDEEHITKSHQKAYDSDGNVSGNASNLDASQMGSAAAMQALKSFTSGGGGGGGGQTQLISMAMSEASKLFDSSNGGGGGDKQAVITGAAMTVMKLMAQHGGGGGGGGMLSMAEGMIGGGNSGGLGPMGMMSLASKFM